VQLILQEIQYSTLRPSILKSGTTFIKDHVSKGECKVEYIDTQHQLADIFTKPLAREKFYTLRNELGILDITCSH